VSGPQIHRVCKSAHTMGSPSPFQCISFGWKSVRS
jgi:hypothetical protein